MARSGLVFGIVGGKQVSVGGEVDVFFLVHDWNPFRWGVIPGDVVHSLRSALDNVVWGATVMHQATLGTRPPKRPFPPRSKGSRVSFPFVTKKRRWKDAVRYSLWGVDSTFLAIFEDAQPSKRGQPSPRDRPLYVLRELSNIDKHHGVNFLGTKLQVKPVEVPPGTVFVPKDLWELEGHAQAGSLQLLTEEAVGRYVNEEMQVDFDASFDIALGKGTRAEGVPIGEALLGEALYLMTRAVEVVVNRAQMTFTKMKLNAMLSQPP